MVIVTKVPVVPETELLLILKRGDGRALVKWVYH